MGSVILGQKHRGYGTIPFSDDVELLITNRFIDRNQTISVPERVVVHLSVMVIHITPVAGVVPL